jgi:hypothetical protein
VCFLVAEDLEAVEERQPERTARGAGQEPGARGQVVFSER